jgi:hypothetical protein
MGRPKGSKNKGNKFIHVPKKSVEWLWLLLAIPLYFVCMEILNHQFSVEEAANLAIMVKWLVVFLLIDSVELFIAWRLNKLRSAAAAVAAVAAAAAFAVVFTFAVATDVASAAAVAAVAFVFAAVAAAAAVISIAVLILFEEEGLT